MGNRWKKAFDDFVSYRFAAAVIASLFFASFAGWIAQELVPPDFAERMPFYERSWRPGVARAVELLRLDDPFHSLWYRFVLSLFFVVLVACNLVRVRRAAARSLRVELPSVPEELRGRALLLDASWSSLARPARGGAASPGHGGEGERDGAPTLDSRFASVASLLARRGLRVTSLRESESIRFAASSGRLRSTGTLLFHAGIVVITVGGLMGSLFGWRDMTYLRAGESAPLPPDSSAALRVDDFRIVKAQDGEIRDYVSTVAIIGMMGDTLAAGSVEVNHPLNFRGVRIYQSSYTVAEGECERALLSYRLHGVPGRRTAELAGDLAAVLGDGEATVSAIRFLPDFRMGPQGAFSASPHPANPALEVEVSRAGEVERGWLFLRHPEFNARFEPLADLALEHVEPVYYTGLELGSNPGAEVLFAGFAAATLGLALMYLCNPRVVKGFATAEGLLVAGTAYRWKASFEREFAELAEAIRREFGERG